MTLRRVGRFPVLHNSLFLAIFYFIFSIPIALFIGIAAAINPDSNRYPFPMGVLTFAIPFFYAIFGFLISAFSLFLYNKISHLLGKRGGIQVEVIDNEEA